VLLGLDELRRRRGELLEALGLGAVETPYDVVLERPGMRLRRYAGGMRRRPEAGVVLIVPAPFKRAYIWDLRPEVSVVRQCLRRGLDVYLLEWTDPASGDEYGLADYAVAFPRASVEAIRRATGADRVILTGHSLGGTFAAVFATIHPEFVERLWLVDAPLTFGGANGGRLAQVLKAVPPRHLAAIAGSPIPGSFITGLSVAALPEDFIWQPGADLLASTSSGRTGLHAAVVRWTLDELALPRRLFLEVAEQFYRRDAFRHAALRFGRYETGLNRLTAPVWAVTNQVSCVAPPASLLDGLRASAARAEHVLNYQGDAGPAIQHVGPLVAPRAHAEIWPAILDFLT
jgi:polyhydroxyalkanoate synthase